MRVVLVFAAFIAGTLSGVLLGLVGAVSVGSAAGLWLPGGLLERALWALVAGILLVGAWGVVSVVKPQDKVERQNLLFSAVVAAVVVLAGFQGFNILLKPLPFGVETLVRLAPAAAVAVALALSAISEPPARGYFYGVALAAGVLLTAVGLAGSLFMLSYS